MPVLMTGGGKVALFDEAAGGGAFDDINAPRNAPLIDPANNLDKVYFHSDLDYFEVVFEATITINHPLIAAGTVPPDYTIAFGWNSISADYLLQTHSLGYLPFALVAQGTNILWPGMPVQEDANGGGRYVSAYVTTTELRLYEWGSIGNVDLPAVSLAYKLLIFKQPPAASGTYRVDTNAGLGTASLGFNKFNIARKYLQVVPGGSPLGLSYGRTIDLNNGAPRAMRPDLTSYDPVPGTLNLTMLTHFGYPRVAGASMAYGGAFAGLPVIQVQAP